MQMHTSKRFPIVYFIAAVLALNISIILPDALAQQDEEAGFHASKIVAGFHIELTVDPGTIEPSVLTKFGMVFRDAETGEPALEVPHTFMLIKDDQVIFRESVTSANYLHEFRFTEEQKGPLTIVIENVNNSGESVEFNLMVVPEFSFNALFVMTGVLAIMLVIMKLNGLKLKYPPSIT